VSLATLYILTDYPGQCNPRFLTFSASPRGHV